MKIGITTTHAAGNYAGLDEFAAEAGFPVFVRGRRSLEKIMSEERLDGIIVWKATGPEFHLKGARDPFFYHPSMAKNRLSAWRKKNQPDTLVKAAGIRPGDHILDCTLGMGADSLVAAYFAGENGSVTGLESSAVIALVIRWGMRIYAAQTAYTWMKPALERIRVEQADYTEYLKTLPDHAYDVVYFDPMFRKPVYKSQAISVIRALANPEPLSAEAVREACRVARRCVVLKEMYDSPEFERLGFTVTPGSPHAKIVYGKIEVTP